MERGCLGTALVVNIDPAAMIGDNPLFYKINMTTKAVPRQPHSMGCRHYNNRLIQRCWLFIYIRVYSLKNRLTAPQQKSLASQASHNLHFVFKRRMVNEWAANV